MLLICLSVCLIVWTITQVDFDDSRRADRHCLSPDEVCSSSGPRILVTLSHRNPRAPTAQDKQLSKLAE